MGAGREEMPGLPAAIGDSASRDLGDPACVSDQLHFWGCTWKSVSRDGAHHDNTCLRVMVVSRCMHVHTYMCLVVCARVWVTEPHVHEWVCSVHASGQWGVLFCAWL